ncbi:MAG: hypothetical protein AB7O97_13060 [Planctomycetota bacterium]
MFSLRDRGNSLSDLVEMRASLRRQQIVLTGALRDVQSELRSWERHRTACAAQGTAVPRELGILWEELGDRERELAMDVVQVEAALRETNAEIRACLAPRPIAS